MLLRCRPASSSLMSSMPYTLEEKRITIKWARRLRSTVMFPCSVSNFPFGNIPIRQGGKKPRGLAFASQKAFSHSRRVGRLGRVGNRIVSALCIRGLRLRIAPSCVRGTLSFTLRRKLFFRFIAPTPRGLSRRSPDFSPLVASPRLARPRRPDILNGFLTTQSTLQKRKQRPSKSHITVSKRRGWRRGKVKNGN